MNKADLIRSLPLIFAALFVAILFIQSGLDKVFNYKGQLSWLTGHFEKSLLAGSVPMMLPAITVMEVTTGLLAAVGVIYLVVTGVSVLIFWASVVGAATLLALFFGQRMAQDYPGAATLVPYFLLMLVTMYLSMAPK